MLISILYSIQMNDLLNFGINILILRPNDYVDEIQKNLKKMMKRNQMNLQRLRHHHLHYQEKFKFRFMFIFMIVIIFNIFHIMISIIIIMFFF